MPCLFVMATLKDISAHLGLSVTQVSRAINDHSDVSEATKKRVREAATELGYVANQSARSLVTGRSGLVCLIRPGGLAGPADISALETVSGLSTAFFERDMQFVLHMMPPEEDVIPAYQRAIASGSFDGFVITETRPDDARVSLLEEMKVPFVVHGRTTEDARHPYFDIDNFEVGRQHVAYLAGLGHKRIALLNGPLDFAYAEFRLNGYKSALDHAGLKFDADLTVHGPMTEGNGIVWTARLFEDGPNRPTALICGNTLLAKGAYTALEAMGLKIPDDVSVVAHDDSILDIRGSAFFPSLTVTKSPFSESSVNLAEILCAEINKENDRDIHRLADVAFIERASTAPKN
ncbi:LacI family transcriptional regulator [Shimia isoporae]|uniref:LacI family transcriptional regulator n=1 Tax=Shimia isoporae TaxID=647720 RepID=A0A4R1N577_9RHOB|nr:substrate-binding domain-containing protein [Shimia isoporae]TCL01182.1 LacI family transcriptional regulator [Shimia isoporae]